LVKQKEPENTLEDMVSVLRKVEKTLNENNARLENDKVLFELVHSPFGYTYRANVAITLTVFPAD